MCEGRYEIRFPDGKKSHSYYDVQPNIGWHILFGKKEYVITRILLVDNKDADPVLFLKQVKK